MKTVLIFLFAFSVNSIYSQVGINTVDPKATLDVTATKTDASTAEGIIAPRLTRTQLGSKDTQYAANQIGTIVYVTDISGTITTKTTNVSKIGYYYFDGTLWQVFNTGVSTADWSITGNTGTIPGTNYLGTSDAKDLVAKTNNAERMRISSAGNMGIGTSTPNASAILDVSATNKSIRIPNVALTNSTDITTVPDPQKGMIVYNTTANEFAFYDGTQWRQPITSVVGVVAPQLVGVMQSNTINSTAPGGYIWYDTKVHDPENAMTLGTSSSDPGKYTVKKAGVHQVFVNFSHQNVMAIGASWYLRIFKNGTPIAAIDATAADGASAVVFAIESFNVGDIITVDRAGAGTGWKGGGLSKMTVFRFE